MYSVPHGVSVAVSLPGKLVSGSSMEAKSTFNFETLRLQKSLTRQLRAALPLVSLVLGVSVSSHCYLLGLVLV